MTNMSYCRFECTLADLRECAEHFDEQLGSEEEHKARQRIWKLCGDIARDYVSDALIHNDYDESKND